MFDTYNQNIKRDESHYVTRRFRHKKTQLLNQTNQSKINKTIFFSILYRKSLNTD